MAADAAVVDAVRWGRARTIAPPIRRVDLAGIARRDRKAKIVRIAQIVPIDTINRTVVNAWIARIAPIVLNVRIVRIAPIVRVAPTVRIAPSRCAAARSEAKKDQPVTQAQKPRAHRHRRRPTRRRIKPWNR